MPEKLLRVFENRSEYFDDDGVTYIYEEGSMAESSKKNYEKIVKVLGQDKYLENLILHLKKNPYIPENEETIDENNLIALELTKKIVDSITSERGRAIGGLLILQLVIKSICPDQSTRLHKSSNTTSDNVFSWKDGLPMRNIDKRLITPILRKYKLIRLNADGFMMTRSLAENYPYTLLYKAKLRGARNEWLGLIEMVEKDLVNPENILKSLITNLIHKNQEFNKLVEALMKKIKSFLENAKVNYNIIQNILEKHLNDSEYHARIFEILLHSFYQTLEDFFDDFSSFSDNFKLAQLQQMRSANKKHKNIGDIELLNPLDESLIIEAWDTKYGKNYLYDELCELEEKLSIHNSLSKVGFITNEEPTISREIEEKIEEIEDSGVTVEITKYIDFTTNKLIEFNIKPQEFYPKWLEVYAETLCLLRYDKAPIDEPTYGFILELMSIMKNQFNKII